MPEKTIILLDDDIVLRERFTLILSKAGYSVIGDNDSNKISELISRHSAVLVITDMFMPGHNGTEAIIKIRENTHIPIIAISGYENMLKLIQPLVNVCLLKPVEDDVLLNAVRDALEKN